MVARLIATALSNLSFILIVLPILYLSEIFRPIRITHFATERMGHLSGDIQLFRARQAQGANKEQFTRIILGGFPCNQALLDIWKRYLPINQNPWLSRYWHYNKHLLYNTRFHLPEFQTTDTHREVATYTDRPTFSHEEEHRGQELLHDMGIGPDDWFITFHVRDAAYESKLYPHLTEKPLNPALRTRDGNILDFIPAAKKIAELGGFAVRVGDITLTPLGDNQTEKIIDYSHRFRSDFGDVYLAAKCRFFLGGPSGLPQLSTLFGVPVAMANMVPVVPHPVGPRSLFWPVQVRDRKTKKILHYREANALGMFDNAENRQWPDLKYDQEGFDIVRNSPDDITNLALDMLDQLNGKSPNVDAKKLQDIYRFDYANKGNGVEFAPTIAPRAALKYRHLIE